MAHRRLTVIGVPLGFAVLALLWALAGGKGGAPRGDAPEASALRPEAGSDFSDGASFVDIANQPLATAISVISNCLKRDRIFLEELRALGLEARFHDFSNGAEINESLDRGQIDAAMGGDMPALLSAVSDKADILFMLGYHYNPVVARRYMTAGELESKRIGVAVGTCAHFTLLEYLGAGGLSGKDVQLVPMKVTEMGASLERGDIDAFSAWEPIPTIALQRDRNFVIIHRGLSSGFLYTSTPFAQGHPEAVRSLVAAEVRAFRWLSMSRTNLTTACRWAMETETAFTGAEPPLSLEKHIDMGRETFQVMGTASLAKSDSFDEGTHLEKLYAFLDHEELIPPGSSWERTRSHLKSGFLEEVLAHPDRYRIETFDYGDEPEVALGK